jgi:hypothetical protein
VSRLQHFDTVLFRREQSGGGGAACGTRALTHVEAWARGGCTKDILGYAEHGSEPREQRARRRYTREQALTDSSVRIASMSQ